MTFLTKLDSTPAGAKPAFGLSQRGRAGMELLGSLQKFSSGQFRPRAAAAFAADPEGARLTAEHAADTAGTKGAGARLTQARDLAESLPLYRLERFCQRFVGEENFNRGIPAIEERRAQFERFVTAPLDQSAGGTLELDDSIVPPKYYDAVEWHLEPGGWDGYDLYGPLFAFAVGPLVFRLGGYAAVGVGDDITQQRVQAIRQFPKDRYDRIYEPGCGGATTARALNTVFPDAELVGCDLSPLLLKNGHRMAERMGLKVHLKQRDVVDTREPDASFDAVITYALHHELPPKVNGDLYREMFRILKPGGDIVMSDPPPFRAVSMFHAVILDWDTRHRNEPFFTAVLHSDQEQMLRDAGFENVESYAIGQDQYPWIVRARKPDTAAVGA
ncbi:MAG: methyltransferase domain-containing protein [Azospirillaceae bacterium]|nr:methyltransferase domain-containing protein [Azospirillaceae bacterium]